MFKDGDQSDYASSKITFLEMDSIPVRSFGRSFRRHTYELFQEEGGNLAVVRKSMPQAVVAAIEHNRAPLLFSIHHRDMFLLTSTSAGDFW